MNTKSVEQTDKNRLPLWSRWLITSLLIVLAIILLFFTLKPLRTYSSYKYVSAGDEFLSNKQYLHADLAYEKALTLLPKNKDVMAKKVLAREASIDVAKLQTLYLDPRFNQSKNSYESAFEFPKDETEALKLSRDLIEKKEYQLAIIPAKTATEMDPGYRDAWLYLGIANLKTAELVELAPDIKDEYLKRAQDALLKARAIDPESKAVAEYLKMVKLDI